MHFVLVHGWGFHAGLWDGVVSHLPDSDVTLVDLGFIAGGPRGAERLAGGRHCRRPLSRPAVAACAGQGAASGRWSAFRALTASAATSRSRGSPPCGVALRATQTQRLPPSGAPAGRATFAPTEAPNVARLDEGLDWLMRWDARDTKARLACPVLALAARDDAIVPEAMTEAIWQHAAGACSVIWSQDGGHVLPLRRPDWCARHVLEFAHAIQP